MEVRFGDEEGAREAVREAVERALLEHGLLRSSAPRGRSAPDEVELPDAAPDDTPTPDVPGDPSSVDARRGSMGADSSGASSTDAPGDSAASEDRPAASEPDSPGVGRSGPDAAQESETDPMDGTGSAEESDPDWDDAAPPASQDGARIRDPGSQSTLGSGTTDRGRTFQRLPDMRVLGQLDGTYVVAETGEGLLLIDQHAADERVNYERLRARLDAPATQALAEPVEIELTAREADLFPAHADALVDLGFRAEPSGDRSVTVEAVPAAFADALDPELLRDALGEFLDGAAETSVDTRVDALLSDLACHPSITGNTSLTEGSVRALLAALDDCENPYACPHGRPVLIEIDREEIEDRFERDYPGHGGRRE